MNKNNCLTSFYFHINLEAEIAKLAWKVESYSHRGVTNVICLTSMLNINSSNVVVLDKKAFASNLQAW